MKISGLKILSSNCYNLLTVSERSIIIQRFDLNGNIKDCSDDSVKFSRLSNSLVTQLDGLEDKEKIARVVDYYLDYAKVTSVADSVLIDGLKYTVVEGIDACDERRNLRFDESLNRDLSSKIMRQYMFNRDEFLTNLEIDEECDIFFEGEDGKSYYKSDSPSTIRFGLASKKSKTGNERVNDLELEFFGKTITHVLGDGLAQIYDELSTEGDTYTSNKFTISDLSDKKRIHIPRSVVPYAKNFVREHNNKVRQNRINSDKMDMKVLQMKLEGF